MVFLPEIYTGLSKVINAIFRIGSLIFIEHVDFPMAFTHGHQSETYVIWLNSMYYGYKSWNRGIIENVDLTKAGAIIGTGCFCNSKGLNEIIIPDNIRYICNNAFQNCDILKIEFSGKTKKIGDYAFDSCCNLTVINGLDKIKEIGVGGFSRIGIEELVVPADIETIGMSGFSGNTNLKTLLIQGSDTYLSENVFSGCTNLTEVTIPADNFYYVSGGQIPRGFYCPSTFENCSNIKTITFTKGETGIMRDWGDITVGTDRPETNITYYCRDSLEKVIFDDGITYIGAKTCQGCKNLTDISLPSTLEKIGDYAFADNFSLSQLVINNTNIKQIAENVFMNDAKLIIFGYKGTYPENYCFDKNIIFVPLNKTESSLILPKSTTVIREELFSQCVFNSIKLPDGVTAIEDKAFMDCFNLIQIEIPDSVRYISENSFIGDNKPMSLS